MKAREPEPAPPHGGTGSPKPGAPERPQSVSSAVLHLDEQVFATTFNCKGGWPSASRTGSVVGFKYKRGIRRRLRPGPVTGRVPVQRRRPSATTQPAGKTTRIRLDMVPGLSTRTTFSQRFPSPANVSMSRAPRLSGLPGPHRGPPAQDQARRRCRPARPRPSHRCRTSSSST